MKQAMFVLISVVLLSSIGFAQYPKHTMQYPAHSLAPSEYTSWSVYFVAAMDGVAGADPVVYGAEGVVGPLEEKWGVDLVINEQDYDGCITLFSTSSVDAVCITNIDILPISLQKKSVAVLFNSTSYGGDKVIVDPKVVTELDDLQNIPTYGLSGTVSQYNFDRGLEVQGRNYFDFNYTHEDPGAAALSMQQNNRSSNASISVWHPFAVQTLNTRPDALVLYDSKLIPGEILDMVVIDQKVLETESGQNFACLVIDVFFTVSQRLFVDDKTIARANVVALGSKLTKLGWRDMSVVIEDSKFYHTPELAYPAITGGELFPFDPSVNMTLQDVMPTVLKWLKKRQVMRKDPKISYNGIDENANLSFDGSFIKRVAERK